MRRFPYFDKNRGFYLAYIYFDHKRLYKVKNLVHFTHQLTKEKKNYELNTLIFCLRYWIVVVLVLDTDMWILWIFYYNGYSAYFCQSPLCVLLFMFMNLCCFYFDDIGKILVSFELGSLEN